MKFFVILKKTYWKILRIKKNFYYFAIFFIKNNLLRRDIHAYLDLNFFPTSFNIFEFFVFLEAKRRHLNKNNINLNIILDNKRFNKELHISGYQWRFFNICLSSLHFFNKIKLNKIYYDEDKYKFDLSKVKKFKNIEVSSNENLFNYTKFTFENLAIDEELLSFDKSSIDNVHKWLERNNLNKQKIITISIRSKGDDKNRNSELNDWIKFCNYLKLKGFDPIIIDDIEGENFETNLFEDFIVCEPAMYNLIFRLNLIKISSLNYFTNSGPSICNLFFDNNYVFIKPFIENSNFGDYKNAIERGYEIGKNLKYKNNNFFRVIKWDYDKIENLKESFDLFEKFILKNNE